MNRYAILHIVDSSYCFPISSNQMVLRLRTAKDDLKEAFVIYESKYVFGETQKKQLMTKSYTSELYDYYTVTLTLTDTRLAYVFYVNDGKENYFFSEDGITTTYNYKLGYYNFFQYPYINNADIMHKIEWMDRAVFYQIFVDRFYMADESKDKSYINCKWGDVPTPKTFAGGDLAGIRKKLGYIKELGANAIYLTPIFKSISNHKYDIIDYKQVDRQFGTNEELKRLIDDIHKKGMRIVLDAVFNHCSDQMEQFVDVRKHGRKSKYYDWFIIDGDRPDEAKLNYETFATCEYMPKLNTSNPEVRKYLIDIACYYITEYKIDGWRLDVSDEISHEFWRDFRRAVKAANEDAVIIGENWHDAYSNLRGDQYDSIMNYAFTKACLDYFSTENLNANELAMKLNDLLMRNTDIVNDMMLNLLDSHDTHRFFSEVGESKEKLKAAISLLFLYPGAPCIFYGTESYTTGGYDPDCRKCMDWEKTTSDECKDIRQLIKYLSSIRQKYDLSKCETKITAVENVFVLNKKCEEYKISLYINNTNISSNVCGKEIKPFSYLIMENGGCYYA